jgi:urease subunit beta
MAQELAQRPKTRLRAEKKASYTGSQTNTIGKIDFAGDKIVTFPNRARATLKVTNTGDRPIQVGSHFHFCEANRFLDFDRAKAYGMKLDLPSGGAVRFEPGQEKEVTLVEVGGKHFVHGFNNLVDGSTRTTYRLTEYLRNAKELGYKGVQ